MASDMMDALMALCQEKHIDQLYLIDRLEQSLAKSYAEILHLDWGAKVTIDRSNGKIYVYKLIPIDDSMDEEGNYTEWEEIDVTPRDTSRIAAQHAKAEINAIVRNSAREQIYEEFSGRIGDIINGTVLQSTPDFTIVKIREGVEAELPHFDQRRYENERNERPQGERYLHNQRLKAVIIDVRDPNSTLQPVRGEHSRPPIVVSRTHPALIKRLFELEVPEIYEGTVEVKSIAREPGMRSKVAVRSLDDRLDPVGACVGPKGSRVRTVVSELRGERVDVILWDADPAVYVANALSPAKVTRVLIDEEKNYAGVIVPDDQLSLAIGKEGQNARLAARLTGWHIDIKNETLAADILKNVPVPAAPAEDLIYEDDEDLEPERCAYVDEDGVWYFADTTQRYTRSQDYLNKTLLEGKRSISGIETMDGQDVLVFSIPVNAVIDGHHMKALAGVYGVDEMLQLLSIDSFEGRGYACIVKDDGSVAVRPEDQTAISGEYNIVSALESQNADDEEPVHVLRAGLKKGEQGVVLAKYNGVSSYFCYTPVGVSDWHLLSIVPSDYVDQRTNSLYLLTVAVGVTVALVFGVIMLFIVIVQHRNRRRLEAIAYVDPVTGGDTAGRFRERYYDVVRTDPRNLVLVYANIAKFCSGRRTT